MIAFIYLLGTRIHHQSILIINLSDCLIVEREALRNLFSNLENSRFYCVDHTNEKRTSMGKKGKETHGSEIKHR